MVNIALIEDDLTFRSELEKIILFQPNWKCIISAGSTEDFKDALLPRIKIDILFMDIDLPGESGIEFLPYIVARLPTTEIIMLTRLENPDLLIKSLSRGAKGYLLKKFSSFQIVEHIKVVLDGGALISPIMARHLIAYVNPPKREKADMFQLSSKEAKVLQLLSEGNTYEETAEIVGITINGVRFHVKNIYLKLNVNNREDAAKLWKGE